MVILVVGLKKQVAIFVEGPGIPKWIARLPAKMTFKTYRMDIKEHSYLTDFFKDRGFDYVEYLGEFLGCRVYRACYNSEDVIAPIFTILVKNNRFRNSRDGYEKRVIYDYFEKGKENYSKWQLAAIRIRLFFDKLFFTIIVLLIPDKEYGLMDKIKLMRGLKMGEQE